MEEFTQPQAAALSFYSERDVRTFLDKRIILATPATRNAGRGVAKMFSRHEMRLLSVLRRLDYGLSAFQQAGIVDWLRPNLMEQMRGSSRERPCYVLLEFSSDGNDWRGVFKSARGDYVDGRENDNLRINVAMAGADGVERPMRSGIIANVNDALWWDDDAMLADIFRPVELVGTHSEKAAV